MRMARLVILVFLAAVAVIIAWRTACTRAHWQTSQPPPEQQSAVQRANAPQQSPPQPAAQQVGASSPATQVTDTEEHLGPFHIGGQDYAVVLRKKRLPEAKELTETVVAMEIQDATGAMQYRRTFPYQVVDGTFPQTWSVSAGILAGMNSTGLLMNYGSYWEVSAPEEEPGGWKIHALLRAPIRRGNAAEPALRQRVQNREVAGFAGGRVGIQIVDGKLSFDFSGPRGLGPGEIDAGTAVCEEGYERPGRGVPIQGGSRG